MAKLTDLDSTEQAAGTTPVIGYLGQYQSMLAEYEKLKANGAAPEVLKLLEEFQRAVEALCFYGSAAQLSAQRMLDNLDAETGTMRQAGDVVRLYQQLFASYDQEIILCRAIDDASRKQMLEDNGIDPKDEEAVKNFFLQFTKKQ